MTDAPNHDRKLVDQAALVQVRDVAALDRDVGDWDTWPERLASLLRP